jgi:histidinol dehydrogenase
MWKSSALPENWNKRTQTISETLAENVKAIVKKVAENGDAALIEFTEKFDKAALKAGNLQVTREEIKAAYSKVSEKQSRLLRKTRHGTIST